MSPSLHIHAAGMVTAVGLDAPSSCAAMRARLDGFRETRFVEPSGDWLIGAAVPLPRNWIGQKRMAHLAAGAIAEVLQQVPGAAAETALILCLAEEERPGRPIRDADAFAREVASILDLPPRMKTHVVAHGRPSGFVALDRARRLLAEGPARHVVIAGVDSYLTGPAVAHYLGNSRLLAGSNANGFIPGEAAAAILCAAAPGGLQLAGLGLAREEAHIYNGRAEDGLDLPLRGDGMARAHSLALGEAQVRHPAIGLKIGDLIGEAFWFRQAALAMQRVQRERSEVQPIWAIGASLGNIGAAVVPLMLGWAMVAKAKGYAPPGAILVDASSDDGACGAAVGVMA